MSSTLVGSDKESILELITSRSNKQRQEICQNYKSLYGKVSHLGEGSIASCLALPSCLLFFLLQSHTL
jgi:hypothetical protein